LHFDAIAAAGIDLKVSNRHSHDKRNAIRDGTFCEEGNLEKKNEKQGGRNFEFRISKFKFRETLEIRNSQFAIRNFSHFAVPTNCRPFVRTYSLSSFSVTARIVLASSLSLEFFLVSASIAPIRIPSLSSFVSVCMKAARTCSSLAYSLRASKACIRTPAFSSSINALIRASSMGSSLGFRAART